MKYKARARRRRVAVTAAGVSAITVLGGTAYASEGGRGGHKDDPDATLVNGGDAKAIIDQKAHVKTAQLALANTGANESLAINGSINIGDQDCTTNLSGGEIAKSEDRNTAGNEGGNCTNDGTQTNSGHTKAVIRTGDADADNTASTTVKQRNSGGSSVNNTANDNELEADDGDATLYNGGNAFLKVDQKASVGTYQGAAANSGGNTAVAVGIGVNYGTQTGTSNVSGGGIHWSDDDNTAGNVGGNASNTAAQTNSGSTRASIVTGNASASNSSTTTVNQNNSGGASSTNTANGNNLTTD
jgi:hypothetical protein